MTKIEFLLLLITVAEFMKISIEIAKLFYMSGYEYDNEEDDDGKDNDE
jgi:hypothetical protein